MKNGRDGGTTDLVDMTLTRPLIFKKSVSVATVSRSATVADRIEWGAEWMFGARPLFPSVVTTKLGWNISEEPESLTFTVQGTSSPTQQILERQLATC